MAVLLNDTTRLLIQGSTSDDIRALARSLRAYGTNPVAGVATSNRSAAEVELPIHDSLHLAVEIWQPTASLIAVTPGTTLKAALDALDHGIKLIVIATEQVSLRDAELIRERAERSTSRVLGPAAAALEPATRTLIGALPRALGQPSVPAGRIGVIAESTSQLLELAGLVERVGLGIRTAVSTGPARLAATVPARLLPLFQRDQACDGVVVQARAETLDGLAEVVESRRYTKPLLTTLAPSRFDRDRPDPNGWTQAETNRAMFRLRATGALVAEQTGDLIQFLSLVFRNAPFLDGS